MADIDISQAEADTLIAMEKHCVESKIWLFPEPGSRLSIALSSPDKRESFILGLTRAQIYRQGFGDKWAVPAPVDRYPNVQDLFSTFDAFMQHCNITELPQIERGLFS